MDDLTVAREVATQRQRQLRMEATAITRGVTLDDLFANIQQGKIKELSEAGNRKLLINLGQTTFLNSVSLGTLISGHTNYAKRGAQMKLCEVDRKIQNIFVVTKLSLVFDVHDKCEDAVASFK